jgi:hypothetical protein
MLFSPRAHNAWHGVKKFMGEAYATGRKFAGTLDGYANLARRVLGAAAPMLTDLGANDALASGVRGLTEYDKVRKTVMDTDQSARGHLNRLAKAAPELF